MSEIERKLRRVEELELEYGYLGVSLCAVDNDKVLSTEDTIDAVIDFLERIPKAITELPYCEVK